jgi:glutamate racemase
MRRIGFFDSGIGGLSVLRHALEHLPDAEFLYVADSAHAPYGDRDPAWVQERSLYIACRLQAQGIEALVIACNTATALAAEVIREHLDIPVVAMEPAIKPAAAQTKTGRVAVLATATTLESRRYLDLKRRYAAGIELIEYAPHHWVEQIERGAHREQGFVQALRKELPPMLAQEVDTWVLACTHFPFIETQLRQVVGGQANIIDPAPAVTAELVRRLSLKDEITQGTPALRLLTSGDPERVKQQAGRFLGREVVVDPFN